MNILLIQLRRLGDLILTTPAINAIREKFPEANVTVAVAKECRALLPAIASVDQFLVLRRGLADLNELAKVWRQNFDITIDFTRNDRSALITLLSRADQRIAADRRKLRDSKRARIYNKLVDCPIRDLHTIDANLALLGPLGIADAARPPSLQIPDSARHAAEELKRALHLDRFVIFHPGTARAEKFWLPERWAEVILFVREKYAFQCVITGGGAEAERSHVTAILHHGHPERQSRDPVAKVAADAAGSLGFARDDGVIDLSGKLDLLTLAALIADARLLVTVDSAPVHLAAATNTPQVALYGPTNPFHWRPRASPAAILTGNSTSPDNAFSPRAPAIPMNRISTQQVIDAIDALLAVPVAASV